MAHEEKKKAKTGQRISSPRSYNFLIKETGEEGTLLMPYYTAGEESLIDFLFDRLREKAKKMTTKERSLISSENYRMILLNREEFPIALTGDSFTTTEVREKINKRYPDKQMVNDFKELRNKPVQIKKMRIWADENSKYKDDIDWVGSVLADVVAVKRTKIAPRTGEPLHKIHLNIGYVTGILWLNDIIRERYCLFSAEFYRLPKQCQKIYRYLSLWNESYLTLQDFNVILNYKPTTNLRRRKKLIEGYLETLKERGFIVDSYRIKGTRGLKTKWYIQVVKKKG